jgi:hypothetical protein
VYGYVLEPSASGTLVTSYHDRSSIDPVMEADRDLTGHIRRRAAGHPGHPGPDHRARLPRRADPHTDPRHHLSLGRQSGARRHTAHRMYR